jgi:uncharacterized metal-binding protein YceD (DUF177 family)
MSNPLRAFDIEFVKLNFGEHRFDFPINDDFFKAFDSSLKAEDLKLDLNFTKAANTFTLVFSIHGKVKVECDRCLSPIDLPIESTNTLMVKVTENLLEDQDDIIYILPSEYKLNIAQPLYDFILLSIPIKKTCDHVGRDCDSTITGKITQVIDVELQETEAGRTTDIEEED